MLVVGADQKITFTTDSNATFEIHLKGSSTVVEISEKYIGSWVSADGDTLVITSDGVEYNGEAIEVVSASADAGIEVDNFGTSGVIFFDEMVLLTLEMVLFILYLQKTMDQQAIR